MAVEFQARRLQSQQPKLKTAFQLLYDALSVFKKTRQFRQEVRTNTAVFQLRNRLFLTRHRDNVLLCLF